MTKQANEHSPPLGNNYFLSNSLYILPMTWLAASLCLSIPSYLLWSIWQGKNPSGVIWPALIFAVVGLFALKDALYRSHTWLKIGRMPLNLNPFPGSIGGDVGGSIVCRLPSHCLNTQPIHLTLSCFHHYQHQGKQGRQEVAAKRWSQDCLAEIFDQGAHSLLKFRFELPQNLPETSAKSEDYHTWKLELHADIPGHKIDRHYQIPVYETRQCSDESFWHLDWQTHSRAEEFVEQAVEQAIDITQTVSGIHIHSPAFKQLGFKLFFTLLGLAVGGVSTYVFLFNPLAFLLGEALGLFVIGGWIIAFISAFQIFRTIDATVDLAS